MNKQAYKKIQNLLDGCDLLPNHMTSYSSALFNSDLSFKNDTILVTGAAGSVGSELSKQLTHIEFKKLILVDNAESPLYHLAKDLEGSSEQLNIEFILIDIRDEEAMNWLFESFKPTIVFHTAAYKHVPLMEDNAYEAVRLNIFATKIIADLSVAHNVKKFVFISTDKAVKPISIMGMTKRLSEAYLKYLKIHSKTDFKATRFGNIFGSNGSVLPIFLRQINAERPITLTTYDATRYFISKTKAGQLILKTATLSKSDGYLFTFNMGKPIKIIDLVKALTKRITGNDKYPVELIGLRAGEKVKEELLSDTEALEFTMHDDILKIKSLQGYSGEKISFNLLSNVKSNMSNTEIKRILENCINTLQSSPALLFAI